MPKQFQLDVKEVFIRWNGNSLIISPHPKTWDGFMDGCEGLSDDFDIARDELPDDSPRGTFD